MDLRSSVIGWIIYLFGSGLVFLIGIGLIAVAVMTFAVTERAWPRRVATVAVLLGIIACGLSAAPLAWWFYASASFITPGWLIVEQTQRPELRSRRVTWRVLTALICLTGVGMELPYQIGPRLLQQGRMPLFIIGDSVTAGFGEREAVTWPVLLARDQNIEVHDFSRMGVGVVLAFHQAERLPAKHGLVLIEIGGNDVLGTTTAKDFEIGLERLLTRACVHDRVVLMFEVPLPPLCNEFGRIQRRLAARHNVRLIPKRLLIGILSRPGNTLDSIHLSQAGHRQMAALVAKLLGM